MMQKFILFDFDGVIGDTFSVALMVFDMVYPGTTEVQLRTAFEGNINKWMEVQSKENKKFRSDLVFSEEYGKHMRHDTKIFPGITDVIKDLSAHYTDTAGDIGEAKKMGIGSIGVSWGFHSRQTLQKAKPFMVVDSPRDLSDAVDAYFS